MEIRSLMDIPASLFYPLKVWAEQSPGHWNLLVGIGMLIMLLGGIITAIYTKKFGKKDEYSTGVYYKSLIVMLLTIMACDIIFPKTYMWNQFFLFKYGLAFLFRGMHLMYQYRKDFGEF